MFSFVCKAVSWLIGLDKPLACRHTYLFSITGVKEKGCPLVGRVNGAAEMEVWLWANLVHIEAGHVYLLCQWVLGECRAAVLSALSHVLLGWGVPLTERGGISGVHFYLNEIGHDRG